MRIAVNSSNIYPDNDGEERPAARGQVDVRIQEVLVQVGVGQQR